LTRYELTARIEVLEERVERLTSALMVLLEAIDKGTAEAAAREVRETLQRDLERPQ
jgi:hypothetical protein